MRTPRWRRPARVRSPYLYCLLSLLALIVLAVGLLPQGFISRKRVPVGQLTTEIVESGYGVGGRWYIPQSWLERLSARGKSCHLTADSSILEAAECAFAYTVLEQAYLKHSRIPLITHQTWRTLDTETWNDIIRESVEQWLEVAMGNESPEGPEMAWFLWDDDGIEALTKDFATDMYDDIQKLPYPVEKADMFRVLVLKWFGGVYADVDARPLKHPYGWIQESDLAPWTDTTSDTELTLRIPDREVYTLPSYTPASYRAVYEAADLASTSQSSINAIFGIGADNLPDPDPTYWRMGYTYPVQVTNWASVMAPHHIVADQFLETLIYDINRQKDNLLVVDPLDITGPPALTAAIQLVTEREDPTLAWNSLSWRNKGDPVGGRGKIVAGDALVLPITGFNPGRSWFQNMGSKSTSHPNARLWHAAAGSWRKMDVKVQFGKFCRVSLGMCKDWKKIPT